jgi:FAD-dependent urate hydroxylase
VDKAGIKTIPSYVRQREYRDGHFEAFMENWETLTVKNVVAAPGLDFFRQLPADLAGKLPQGRYTRSCAIVNFEPLAGRRCLVIGGRQSALTSVPGL